MNSDLNTRLIAVAKVAKEWLMETYDGFPEADLWDASVLIPFLTEYDDHREYIMETTGLPERLQGYFKLAEYLDDDVVQGLSQWFHYRIYNGKAEVMDYSFEKFVFSPNTYWLLRPADDLAEMREEAKKAADPL